MMKRIIYVASCMFFTFNVCLSQKEYFTPQSAVVQTQYGKVRGYVHNGIYTYKGIPYAKAERFMPPEKPDEWKGIRNSMAYGPACPQNSPNVIDASEFFFHHDFGYPGEDCLRINIWSPRVNDSKKRPVMVWFHGGGYSTGSGNELPSYDGENLSKRGDVVVVNLNHRLNLLGFLNLSSFGEKYKYSANLGILDLIEALQWIKANISAFGGDPNNITIFGQSGGGRKVCNLLSTPKAKSLFHKAIIESGASLELFNNAQSSEIGEMVVRELGLSASNIDSIQRMPYEILRLTGERVLKNLNQQFLAEGKSLDGFRLRWGPTTDGDIIPFQPSDDRALALMPDIPIILGSTKNEFVTAFDSACFINPKTISEARNIIVRKYPAIADAFIAEVQKAYPKAIRPVDLLDVDIRGRNSVLQLANLRSRAGKVYTYLFTWESPVLDGRFRSCHCLELPFVFDNIERCQEMTGGGKGAYVLAEKMSIAWINFARYGNPNHRSMPKWEAYTKESGATMIFDNTCKLVHHHDKNLLDLVIKNN
jgi:para-nitrobenzyl esterase